MMKGKKLTIYIVSIQFFALEKRFPMKIMYLVRNSEFMARISTCLLYYLLATLRGVTRGWYCKGTKITQPHKTSSWITLLVKTALKSVEQFKRSERTDNGNDFILYYVKIIEQLTYFSDVLVWNV